MKGVGDRKASQAKTKKHKLNWWGGGSGHTLGGPGPAPELRAKLEVTGGQARVGPEWAAAGATSTCAGDDGPAAWICGFGPGRVFRTPGARLPLAATTRAAGPIPSLGKNVQGRGSAGTPGGSPGKDRLAPGAGRPSGRLHGTLGCGVLFPGIWGGERHKAPSELSSRATLSGSRNRK